MPRKKNAVPVARLACFKCTRRALVFQANNGYLYTRCDQCGANQDRGTAHQVAVWQAMEPIAGQVDPETNLPLLIHRPKNVPESAGALGCALAGTAPAVTVIEPETVGARTEETEPPAGTPPAAAAVPESTEKRAEKPKEPAPLVPAVASVPVTVPEPKGAGTVQGGGGGFWWLLGFLALATGAGVAYATREQPA